MNRSVERRRLAVRGTIPGELVAGWFVHPTRGPVRCPATPLMASGLRGLGYRVREDQLTPTPDAADGVLFTASYLDRAGAPVGLAVAVHHADRTAIRTAREAVLTWSTAWRSRRIVVAAPESCSADLCGHVEAGRREIGGFVRRGDQVVLIGRRGHPATASLADYHPEVVLVESAEEVAALRLDPDRLSYLVAPGMVVEQAMRAATALRARYPRLRGPHPDSLCYAASDHLATVRAVSAGCDRVFVLGAATDTVDLADAAHDARKPVHVVDRLERIRPSWLADTESIGIAAAPSAPPLLLHTVIDALSGMGPLSVVRRRTVTEPFALAVAGGESLTFRAC